MVMRKVQKEIREKERLEDLLKLVLSKYDVLVASLQKKPRSTDRDVTLLREVFKMFFSDHLGELT